MKIAISFAEGVRISADVEMRDTIDPLPHSADEAVGFLSYWKFAMMKRSSIRQLFARPVTHPIRKVPHRFLPALEALESRLAPSVNVLTFHNDIASTGLNPNETQLTPANVTVNSFGKLYTTPVDGQVYAEPLIDTGVTIANGPNTQPAAAGVHDVVFVATEHDSLYAIDASSTGGAVLWQRTFLDVSNPNNNTLGATAISTVLDADVSGNGNIAPEIGITGTPVIDPATNTLYLVAKTKETIGGNTHFVQRLHAVNISDGTDRVAPYLLGDTTNSNTNNTPIYVYGTGYNGANNNFDSVTDPYNGTGKPVVQFSALHENQRGALNLVNNTIYVEWASHGDTDPYHGWVVALDVSNLQTSGWRLSGVFCPSANGGEAGIWQGGGRLAFEANGSAMYFEIGNGPGSTTANPVLDSNGFPVDGNYYNALVKLVADSSTTPTNQNLNGWGLKVADYFMPYNTVYLDQTDGDFGSGASMVLPDSVGIAGHPHLLVAAGKTGQIYLVDRDNMRKFNATYDNVLNSVTNGDGTGHLTPPVLIGSSPNGSYSTPAFYNGTIYWISGYQAGYNTNYARTFVVNANATLSQTSQASITNFGNFPGSPVVSADGTSGGITWLMDRNLNQIHAYDASTGFATELWNSGQRSGGLDSLNSTVVKFAVPTVANGRVYVGTSNSLVVYGLVPPSVAADSASVTFAEDTTATNTGTFSDSGVAVTISVSGGGTVSQAGSQSGTWSWSDSSPLPDGDHTITITATNAYSTVSTTSFVLHVTDKAPSVAADNSSVSAQAFQTLSNTGTFSDYDDAVTITASQGTVTQSGSQSGTWSWSQSGLPVGVYPVTITATNADGSNSTTSFTASVSIANGSAYILNSTASGAVTASGNGNISLPSALVVDSNSASAILASGNAQINASGGLFVVGGISKTGNAVVSPNPGSPASTNDPLASLTPPSLTNLTNYGAVSVAGNSTTTLNPGIYTSIKISGKASVTMTGGTYIILGGGFTVSGNASVSGSGVTIFNAGSSYNGTTDGGNFGGITLSGNGNFNLSTPTSGTYAGILIYQSRVNTRALSIGGNAMVNVQGTIYAANAMLTMSGNGNLQDTLVVNTLNISGNVALTQMAAGSDGAGDAPGIGNSLLAGDLALYINDPSGLFTADELARIQDAINTWDALIAPYNVTIAEVSDPTLANMVIDIGTTSACGGSANGVLGCFNAPNSEITMIQDWNWYAGSDPTLIGAGQYDFETTVLHELGHAIGLGGATNASSPMSETLAAGTVARTVTTQDLNIPDPPAGADPQTAAGFHSNDGRNGLAVTAAYVTGLEVNQNTALTAERATAGDRFDVAHTAADSNFRMDITSAALTNATGSSTGLFGGDQRTVQKSNRPSAPLSQHFGAWPLVQEQDWLSVADRLFGRLAAGLPAVGTGASKFIPATHQTPPATLSTDRAALEAVMAELGRADRGLSSRFGVQTTASAIDALLDDQPQSSELAGEALFGVLAAGLWFNRTEVETREERRAALVRTR